MARDAVIIEATIDHLRQFCPPFAGRVAGAADFRLGLQNYNANLLLPAAYVVPASQESPNGNEQAVGLWQIVHKSVDIVVELTATADRRGQNPVASYDAIEAALFAALLNWAPLNPNCRVPNKQGFYFAAGQFLDLDRARLFYAWTFGLHYQITDLDGWQQPEPEPLLGIEVDIYSKENAAPVEPTD